MIGVDFEAEARIKWLTDEIDFEEETLHTCAPTMVKEEAVDRIRKLVAERNALKASYPECSLVEQHNNLGGV